MALLQIAGDEETFGLLAIYRDGPRTGEAVAVDAKGQPRPDLAERLPPGRSSTEPIEAKKWTGQASWKKAIRRMADALPKEESRRRWRRSGCGGGRGGRGWAGGRPGRAGY